MPTNRTAARDAAGEKVREKIVAISDYETRGTEDDHEALRLWLRLLTCTNLIESDIRRRLSQQFATTLPRFDLMAQLERAPGGLTMGELSKRMMVTGGNVTGITDQVEREGYVVREVDPADRRVFRVRLTDKGLVAFRRMAAEHEKWIRELMGGLDEDEVRQLFALLDRLKGHILETNRT